MFAAHLCLIALLVVLVLSGSQAPQALPALQLQAGWSNANAAVLDLPDVPGCRAMLREVLQRCHGLVLELGGSALIKYAMLSFEHDVTHIKVLPWYN